MKPWPAGCMGAAKAGSLCLTWMPPQQLVGPHGPGSLTRGKAGTRLSPACWKVSHIRAPALRSSLGNESGLGGVVPCGRPRPLSVGDPPCIMCTWPAGTRGAPPQELRGISQLEARVQPPPGWEDHWPHKGVSWNGGRKVSAQLKMCHYSDHTMCNHYPCDDNSCHHRLNPRPDHLHSSNFLLFLLTPATPTLPLKSLETKSASLLLLCFCWGHCLSSPRPGSNPWR